MIYQSTVTFVTKQTVTQEQAQSFWLFCTSFKCTSAKTYEYAHDTSTADSISDLVGGELFTIEDILGYAAEITEVHVKTIAESEAKGS